MIGLILEKLATAGLPALLVALAAWKMYAERNEAQAEVKGLQKRLLDSSDTHAKLLADLADRHQKQLTSLMQEHQEKMDAQQQRTLRVAMRTQQALETIADLGANELDEDLGLTDPT